MGRGWVVGRGVAGNAQGRKPPEVLAVRGDGWKARFASEDGGRGRVEAVGNPSARSVPEGVHCSQGVGVGGQEV